MHPGRGSERVVTGYRRRIVAGGCDGPIQLYLVFGLWGEVVDRRWNVRTTEPPPESEKLPDLELPNVSNRVSRVKEELEGVLPEQDSVSNKCKDALTPPVTPGECKEGSSRPSTTPATGRESQGSDPSSHANQARLEEIKRKHDFAKAVKSDNAEVPIHIWDEAICRGTATLR